MALPTAYTPLSWSSLEKGMQFGEHCFRVKQHSHEKSKQFIEESDLEKKTSIVTPFLFPSEMWGCARVLSQYFGRLNEVAVSQSCWNIYGKVLPEESLFAKSRVVKKQMRNELPFVVFKTVTKDSNNHLLISCEDEFLLLHDVDTEFYQERGKTGIVPKSPDYECLREVYFRHVWDDGKWFNNIHTDDYARSFGYERGLPEFIMYMDWTFLPILERCRDVVYNGTTIETKKILPIYKDEIIKVVAENYRHQSAVRFFRGNQERFVAEVKTEH